MNLSPPTRPYRGLRNTDIYGSGAFGASRGSRKHAGLDIIAQPGDDVVSPLDGRVVRIGLAYYGSVLGSLHIQGVGEYADARIKLLYVEPDVDVNATVRRGQHIGQAQDVASYWHEKSPRSGTMKNHIHIELMIRCDPQRWMNLPEVA
jgi:murein DD-endopeptidase MepM/ murein hydrolase activator NlpD